MAVKLLTVVMGVCHCVYGTKVHSITTQKTIVYKKIKVEGGLCDCHDHALRKRVIIDFLNLQKCIEIQSKSAPKMVTACSSKMLVST